MSRYIDVDKLLDGIECIDISDCTDIDDIFIEIEKEIDEYPTADVEEVRHGKWLNVGGSAYKCSECGFGFVNLGCRWSYNYCQNCGAKMDGGD